MIAFRSDNPAVQNAVSALRRRPRNDRANEIRNLLLITRLAHSTDIFNGMKEARSRYWRDGWTEREIIIALAMEPSSDDISSWDFSFEKLNAFALEHGMSERNRKLLAQHARNAFDPW